MKRAMRNKKQPQRGVALTELAMVLPIMVLLLGSAIDLGRWFHTHFAVSHIAYEATRYAGSLEDLELCSANCAALPGHIKLTNRVQQLISQYSLASGSQVATSRVALPIGSGANGSYVAVELSLPFSPLIAIAAPPVKAKARGPYME